MSTWHAVSSIMPILKVNNIRIWLINGVQAFCNNGLQLNLHALKVSLPGNQFRTFANPRLLRFILCTIMSVQVASVKPAKYMNQRFMYRFSISSWEIIQCLVNLLLPQRQPNTYQPQFTHSLKKNKKYLTYSCHPRLLLIRLANLQQLAASKEKKVS